MSEWEYGLGLLWVLAVLRTAARSDEQPVPPTRDSPRDGPAPVPHPARGSNRPGWPPGGAPPRPDRSAFPLAV